MYQPGKLPPNGPMPNQGKQEYTKLSMRLKLQLTYEGQNGPNFGPPPGLGFSGGQGGAAGFPLRPPQFGNQMPNQAPPHNENTSVNGRKGPRHNRHEGNRARKNSRNQGEKHRKKHRKPDGEKVDHHDRHGRHKHRDREQRHKDNNRSKHDHGRRDRKGSQNRHGHREKKGSRNESDREKKRNRDRRGHSKEKVRHNDHHGKHRHDDKRGPHKDRRHKNKQHKNRNNQKKEKEKNRPPHREQQKPSIAPMKKNRPIPPIPVRYENLPPANTFSAGQPAQGIVQAPSIPSAAPSIPTAAPGRPFNPLLAEIQNAGSVLKLNHVRTDDRSGPKV